MKRAIAPSSPRKKESFLQKIGKKLPIPLSTAMALILAISILAYALTQSVVFAIIAFAFIVALVASDFSSDKDWKQNAVELLFAVVFAIAAWFALSYVLQTDSPMNVVTSCSMLPALQRGDLVFIHGGVENAPVVNASFSSLSQTQVHKSLCYAGNAALPCTDEVIIGNRSVKANRENDIIVFDPKPTGPGLLIHRIFTSIQTEQGVYYMTKGDNNPVLDQENSRFNLVSGKDIKGHVVFRIPYVGYLKLLLFLQFQTPQGCETTLEQA